MLLAVRSGLGNSVLRAVGHRVCQYHGEPVTDDIYNLLRGRKQSSKLRRPTLLTAFGNGILYASNGRRAQYLQYYLIPRPHDDLARFNYIQASAFQTLFDTIHKTYHAAPHPGLFSSLIYLINRPLPNLGFFPFSGFCDSNRASSSFRSTTRKEVDLQEGKVATRRGFYDSKRLGGDTH